MKRYLLLAAILLCFSGHAWAGESNVGKKLPPLGVNFISNAPNATGGKPMVVEFWATWCPPCRQSIPHLNEVYKAYKDRGLVVVGISKESRSTVTDFMKKLPMDYAVALDAGGNYSGQFGISGIPHALLVDNAGKIVWEGHPMALNAAEIEKVLPAGGTPASPSSPPIQPAPTPANKRFY